jgi:hypothetical protein
VRLDGSKVRTEYNKTEYNSMIAVVATIHTFRSSHMLDVG